MKWQFEISDKPVNPNFPVLATQVFDSGAKKGPFYFSIEQFLTAFESGDTGGKVTVFENTPALPNGTIQYACSDDRTVHRVTLELPKSIWDIRYEKVDDFFPIGLPRLIVKYEVKRLAGSFYVSEIKIFSVMDDGKAITEDTPLYSFPYPNVYKDSGSVCMGANERITLSDLTELQSKFIFFIQSPFNEELGMRTTTGVNNFLKFIELNQGKPFNDEWLMPPSAIYKTFGDLINK